MIVIPAELADLPRLVKFRTDSAAWLSQLGLDQWSRPFPAEHMAKSIKSGEVFLIKEHLTADAAATVTLDRDADPRLWTSAERQESALYVHKLSVDRRYSGDNLGGRILDWCGDEAAKAGARWLRLDAWTTNPKLHAYYQAHGFTHVRTSHDPTVVSGWAAQRPASRSDTHGSPSRLKTG
ncbi:GNAT family N-acetyltransferase [Streptomyces globisporus]|uniref:GNAT family N-acetyltransferase n=1 Tax=Streptomyces globisporus TaxID=1908 RepID=A0A927GPJ8_STRGL|nr:GNAT family N-acetyltransferase [Streptomyces globisporus]